MNGSFYIKGVKVSCCTLESSVNAVIERARSRQPAYVCVTDAGNIVNASRRSSQLKKAINNSLISLPDGRPISILANLKGIKEIERVAGPDFMEEMFRKTSGTDLKHFFLGDTDEVHQRLEEKISGNFKLNIAGFSSPEFGEWSAGVNENILRNINESGAAFIWVCLGGGRQEVWMAENFSGLKTGVMIGAGAALRFYTGDIKRAPKFFQSAGLEWMFRLAQQPGKMFTRYLKTLPLFAVYMFQQLLSSEKQIQKQSER